MQNQFDNKIGILITNLGSPDAPTSKAVRRYLSEFLWDPRVVTLPRALWWIILHALVLPLRSKHSAKLYQQVWTQAGSPLVTTTHAQVCGIKKILTADQQNNVIVEMAMRYGSPYLTSALKKFQQQEVVKIVVLPLYPQYSEATTGSTIAAVKEIVRAWNWAPDLRMIQAYSTNKTYIKLLTASIQQHWQQQAPAEKLLFSFHGLPQRSIEQGDPYYRQCLQTAQLVAAELRLPQAHWQAVFQSRFGKQQWLEPYCDRYLQNLPKQGIKTVDIICPGFAADCLETLEEIQIRNRKIFAEAGGEGYHYIPALNARMEHLHMLTEIIMGSLG